MKQFFKLLLFIGFNFFIPNKGNGQTSSSPPIPLSPLNLDSIFDSRPLFSWVPIITDELNFQYYFKLVEVFPNQTANHALLSNPPVYERTLSGQENQLVYPLTAPLLQRGKQYTWQISASLPNRSNDFSKFISIPGEVFSFFLMAKVKYTTCLFELQENENAGILYQAKNDLVIISSDKINGLKKLTFSVSCDTFSDKFNYEAKWDTESGNYYFYFSDVTNRKRNPCDLFNFKFKLSNSKFGYLKIKK